MKTIYASVALAGLLLGASLAMAQPVTETTTVLEQPAVITNYMPDTSMIEVRTAEGATPIRYRYTKTTTFTDSEGRVLTSQQITASSPATIYYTRVGSDLVATRVVVQQVKPAVVEESTTTTTTEKKEED